MAGHLHLAQLPGSALRLMAVGHTTGEIAAKLHLSPRSVETHRARIHLKLGLDSRAELVSYALGRQLLGS